ncbi:MAG TPA: hypothetical protein VGS13_05675 [Stellaceae bacterium]|nr:hypothetical protein [Stellaceae bacterium]
MNVLVGRGIATVAAILIYGWVNFLISPVSTVLSGDAAVRQLQNSDVAYVTSIWGMRFFGNFGLPFIGLLAVLAAIWWVPARRWLTATRGAAVLLALVAAAPDASAYYDKNDYTEAIYILPNQSAFVIPDAGANKDAQAQFMSLDYLKANKVAAKRVVIPHVKLSGSGAWSDFYVPSARVIIVDRTPYNREWVTAANRGTSNRNEGMPCQSSEGLNITAGISIGVSVREEDAARYLYYFGTVPPKGNPSEPAVIFTSVYNARSVADVMDRVGRGEVLSLVCHEISARTLNNDNKDAGAIIKNVTAGMTAFLTERGITLDYLGWADTFTFDPAVQRAINDKFTADTVGPVLNTLQDLANVRIKEGLGEGLATRGLPANLVAIPSDLLDFTTLLGAKASAAAAPHAAPGK